MIHELKPYPEMKHSGVEWLEDVPETWKVLPNRALFDEVKETNYPDEEMLSVTIKRGVIKQSVLLDDSSKKDSSNLDKSKYKLLQPGDLAYNKMRAWQGAIGISEYRGIISPAYVVQRSRVIGVSKYWHYLFRTPAFAKEAERLSYGITSDMWSLRPEHFKLIKTCVPSHDEQDAIVKYLDYMDRRIKKLIVAKKKLIKLLEEQKQAIIHQAVTKGLDPNVPMKDSGVEWLGKIPEPWTVTHFKRIAQVKGKLVDPKLEEQRNKTLIAPNHIEKDGTARILGLETADAQGADSGKYEVIEGMIIYSKIRPYLRKAIIAPVDCLCSADMYPVAVIKDLAITYEYLLLEMLSLPFTQYTIECSLRAAMPKINREALGEAPLWLPPLKEQAQIITFLDGASSAVDETVIRTKKEIRLLNEYRTRLISDVVTGKLDVREAAESLPDANTDGVDSQ